MQFNKFYFYTRTFFLIASYQIFQNAAILINRGLFFQEKDSLQLNPFQFPKMKKLLPNSVICFGKLIFNGFSH